MQGLPRRYLFTSAVYAGALLLLLCLAALAGSFTQVVGGARISGRFSPFPLFNKSLLEELTVSWNGLDLRFSRAAPAGLLRFESAGNAADIVEGDARLRLSSPGDLGSALTISQVAGASTPTAEVLTIAFRVSGIVRKDSAAGRLSWQAGERSFELSVPQDARIDYDARSIIVHVGAALPVLRLVALAPVSGQEAPPLAAQLPDEKSLPTQEQLTASLARFSDLAYSGWTFLRYSANDGTWRMADGRQGFAEEIGIGLLAESLARGTFADVVQMWSAAVKQRLALSPAPVLSFSTCVYTGRVRDFARHQQDRDSTEIGRLEALAARGDASLAEQPGVLLFLLDRGGPIQAKAVLSTLRGLDVARLSLPEVLTALKSFEDYAQLVGDDPTVLPAARDLIEQRLLPSLTAANDGSVFLRSQGGGVDVNQSIRCGVLFLRSGSLLQSSRLSALGRGLIVSSLSLSAGSGFLPATLSLASGRIASRDGALAPESVYPVLPTGRHIPREIPLYRLMGQGCWVWTAADLVSADQSDNGARLIFSYPPGVPHHLVFRGLRPFSQIRLHGIPWHADPSYARYSDGWTYDEQTRTLFMKITGRQDQEEVDFRF
jgi:hypothetical protein